MTHECRYCSQPGATVPRYSIISKGKLIVIGYVHDECV